VFYIKPIQLIAFDFSFYLLFSKKAILLANDFRYIIYQTTLVSKLKGSPIVYGIVRVFPEGNPINSSTKSKQILGIIEQYYSCQENKVLGFYGERVYCESLSRKLHVDLKCSKFNLLQENKGIYHHEFNYYLFKVPFKYWSRFWKRLSPL